MPVEPCSNPAASPTGGDIQRDFFRLTRRSITLAEQHIARQETAEMRLYAGMGYALEARLHALRDERRATARAGVKAREHLLRAIELDPHLADAFTGVGLYNYYVDTLSWAVRMLRFFMGIPGGNKHDGIRQLEVAMRDGVKLFTIVYTPKDTSTTYPLMLHRTPYGSPPYGPDNYRASLGPSAAFAAEKFIFVYQDVRGKFRSEGDFVVMRPLVPQPKPPKATDESTDTYDTIDWLVKNVPNNNGRVGQWGISYPGSQTVWGMIDAHPALKASSPQAPAIDMFLGDDFHHNGAFRLMYTFSWLAGNARPRAGVTETRGGGFSYGTPDGYQFFLDAGTVANINEKYFNYSVPTWNEYMEHPNYDEYWERQNPLKHAKNITHAVLNVAGWFDAEDFYGPLETYKAVERTPGNKNRLVIGPWLHGGWASMPGDALGDIRFGSNTAEHYRNDVELPFFRYHLKGQGAEPTTEATMFGNSLALQRILGNLVENAIRYTRHGGVLV